MRVGPWWVLLGTSSWLLACGGDSGGRTAEADVGGEVGVEDGTDATETATPDTGEVADTGPRDSDDDDADPVDTGADDVAPGDADIADIADIADSADSGDSGDADVADSGATIPDWDALFDVPAMLVGARSDVPDEVLAQWPTVMGEPQTRHSQVTGLEFHIPGVISSVAMSPVPVPLRRVVNGVEYWQVTGEMSLRFADEWGLYFAVGPIDERGVNHRDEPFDPFEPSAETPDEPASHPRAGLTGAFFTVRWPVTGFHGGIIQHASAADAGEGYPQAAMAWLNVDAQALLAAGYGVASIAGGGTAYARKEADGSLTVDTNPESGSGIFFTEDYELWPGNGVYETDRTKLVQTLRVMKVAAADFAETPYDANLLTPLHGLHWDEALGQDVALTMMENVTNPYAAWPFQFGGYEIVRDAVVVFKHLLRQATGVEDLFAILLGWSGSGVPTWSLVSGTQLPGHLQHPAALGVPPGAGNFNAWRDPASGRRFDAFVCFAPARDGPLFLDTDATDPSLVAVDPEYPVQAPIVWIHGDADVVTSPFNPIMQANAIAQAWPTSKLAAESIDDYVSILHVAKMSHQSRDQLFAAWDHRPADADALWYDPSLGTDDAALNAEGRGLRLSEVYARQVLRNGTRDIRFWLSDMHSMPRMTGLYLGVFASLRAHARDGTPLPTSRVLPLLAAGAAVDATTPFPTYPVPCETARDSPWDAVLACREGLEADGLMFNDTLPDFERAAISAFVTDNPLARLEEMVMLPDVAAPRGFFYFAWGVVLRRDFSAAELADRYGDDAGYISALRDAIQALVEVGLYDAHTGDLEVEQADDE